MKKTWIRGVVAAAVMLSALAGFRAWAGEGVPGKGKNMTPSEAQQWNLLIKEFSASLSPGENGRFQGVPIDGTSIFVLDTRAGHLWVWTFGEKGGFITYQGRVFPGLRMGDIIDSHAKEPGR